MKEPYLIVCLWFVTNYVVYSQQQDEKFLQQTKTWADRLGAELWHFGKVVTRRNTVMEKYKTANLMPKNGDNLTTEIAERIKEMLEKKVAAVQRIMDAAGELATSSSNDRIDTKFQYYNTKDLIDNLTNPPAPPKPKTKTLEKLPKPQELISRSGVGDEYLKDADADGLVDDEETEPPLEADVAKEVIQVSDGSAQQPLEDKTRLNLTENPNFFNLPVNTEHSAVHVPSNVYDRSKDVIQGIKWSEKLDNIYKNNYRDDPSLTWQYFGSSTGFMRQFPAMIWRQTPTDTYDCRTRSWYIDAASSPKDVVILVDRSGSMTGMQKEIAKHVVNNLLDTLGNNDYVNIFTFSNVTEPLVACFNDTLVQANLANIRELKENMDNFKTENIANFTDALTMAFRLLENYRIGSRNKSGAGCNQAIMLVTDGVQYNYKELFEDYNWRELPFKPVRVFTYLIGREVSDVREVKWMACANQGYYVHLSTFAEVREQVLHYIPVMARPMVLLAAKPQPTWSSVYADVTDPKLTNWLWMQKQRYDQKERFLAHRRHPYQKHNIDEPQKAQSHNFNEMQTYQLMTSISMPVYDRRPNANITEHVLVREAHWMTIVRETRVANLLGVAGTDVPIQYIRQLMKPHSIGVNGYAFVITNNGYILTHPDLRPTFQGILKPAYNRVDMVEVELPDDQLEPREFNKSLLDLRKDVLYERPGHYVLDMKYHLDDMKRVIRGRRYYYYKNITGTPFSLVVVLPERYGTFAVQQTLQQDIHRQVITKNDFLKYFIGQKWKVHPEWVYCKYLDGKFKFKTPEEELLHFFNRMLHEPWKWSQPKNASCDRDLIHSLVFDAKQTNFFDQNITTTADDKQGHEFMKRYRVTIAFIATHSGLTRWQDFPQNILPQDENSTTRLHFSETNNRAIDQVWYRRAVEQQHYVEEDSFVYSVPFDDMNLKSDDILVTASHAIFYTKDPNRNAPAAVVGYQFYLNALYLLFHNITNGTCETDLYACYVLDNNAYVILSPEREDTGKWFGHVRISLMKMLVDERIYQPIVIYDYQAVCFPERAEHASRAFTFQTPLNHILELFEWFFGTILYFGNLVLGNQEVGTIFNPPLDDDDYESTSESNSVSYQPPTKQNEKEFDKSILITKTKPTPCDERRTLYEFTQMSVNSAFNRRMLIPARPFIVQRVPNSNLVLVVVNALLKMDDGDVELDGPNPVPVDYNMTLACRMREDDLPRRRYAKCINKHVNESKIELCGGTDKIFSFPIYHLLFFTTFFRMLL